MLCIKKKKKSMVKTDNEIQETSLYNQKYKCQKPGE